MTEDEMVGWHHQLDGHEFEQAPRVGDGGQKERQYKDTIIKNLLDYRLNGICF